jgi:hypothetical protein
MAKPRKTTGDLFASMEDDLKQFWAALSGALRVAAGAMAKRVGLAAPPVTQRTRSVAGFSFEHRHIRH